MKRQQLHELRCTKHPFPAKRRNALLHSIWAKTPSYKISIRIPNFQKGLWL